MSEKKGPGCLKIILIIVAAIFVIGIIAAALGDRENTKEPVSDKTETSEVTAPAEPENPLMTAELQTESVGEAGECAYIVITQDEMDAITGDALAEFCEDVVEGSEYNWVSIISEDGNVIYFPLGFGGSDDVTQATCGVEREAAANRGLPDETTGEWVKVGDTFEYSEVSQ